MPTSKLKMSCAFGGSLELAIRSAFRSVRICFKESVTSVVMMQWPATDSTFSLKSVKSTSGFDKMTGFTGLLSKGALAARCERMELRIDSRAELLIGPQIVKTLRLDGTQIASVRP